MAAAAAVVPGWAEAVRPRHGPSPDPSGRRPEPGATGSILAAVAALAFALRLVPTWASGGWWGLGRYDDGVYVGMAISLLHGELPYRDLVLLHPPGIVLAMAPVAGLTAVVGDDGAFVIAKTLVMATSAGTAALIAWTVRRRGARAMAAGGATYAVFVPAAYADASVTLEAISNLLLAAALALLIGARALTHRNVVVAGVLLGLAAATKIWGVIPVVVLAVWLWRREGRSLGMRFLLAAAAGTSVVCLPFFVAAPRQMWRMVVLDQLERPDTNPGVIARLPAIFGLPRNVGPGVVALLMFVIVMSALVWLVLRTLRGPEPEPLAASLFVAALVVLVASPSFFLQYGAFVAVPLAWCVAVAVRRPRARAVLGVALVASMLASSFSGPGTTLSPHFKQAMAGVQGCIASDDPMVLIATDTLTQNLRRGCTTWIDVTGMAYDVNGIRPSPNFFQPRGTNGYWQYGILGPYLEGADAMVVGRASTGLHPDQLTYWSRAAVTTSSGRYTLYELVCPTDRSLKATPFIRWANSTGRPVRDALADVRTVCDPGH